jgi:hypothetical protein
MKPALLTLIALSLSSAAYAGSGDALNEKNLAALHGLVQPKPEEVIWKDSIPWRTDLWQARREAAAAGKPIFLWEMDGHPLGCT